MKALSDQQLLREYAQKRSETAFAELVRRYLDLVYSAALRRVDDPHQAQDVTQGTFVALAQNARHLADHPVLSGWLHRTTKNIAANLVRSNVRRQAREQEALAMNQLLSQPPDAHWHEISPHLDAALDELEPSDRNAVMLRYFEKKSAREMAGQLGISDEAAQRRVSRAVERLRELFAKRGVKVGASGLAIAISANAVHAAPAGLIISITPAALTSAALATTTTFATAKIIAMTTLQKTIVATTIAALAGIGVYEYRAATRMRRQVQELQQQQTALTETIQQLESERNEYPGRLAGVEATGSDPVPPNDLLRLRGEVARMRRENEESRTPITREDVEARYKNAQELARNGESARALEEYLWCYDVGMRQVGSYAGVRGSYLLNSIATLGESYPEALTALRERRDQAMERILNSENDAQAARDFSALNRALNDDQFLFSTYDQLAPDDKRRKALAKAGYDQFIAAQRYNDALHGRSYEEINWYFEIRKAEHPLPATIPNLETILHSNRRYVITSTAKDVEALAGAGDLVHARSLSERLLAYDNSPQTVALLNQHLARAGQPGLLGAGANH